MASMFGCQDQLCFLQQLDFAFGDTGQATMELVELCRDLGLARPVALLESLAEGLQELGWQLRPDPLGALYQLP